METKQSMNGVSRLWNILLFAMLNKLFSESILGECCLVDNDTIQNASRKCKRRSYFLNLIPDTLNKTLNCNLRSVLLIVRQI